METKLLALQALAALLDRSFTNGEIRKEIEKKIKEIVASLDANTM